MGTALDNLVVIAAIKRPSATRAPELATVEIRRQQCSNPTSSGPNPEMYWHIVAKQAYAQQDQKRPRKKGKDDKPAQAFAAS